MIASGSKGECLPLWFTAKFHRSAVSLLNLVTFKKKKEGEKRKKREKRGKEREKKKHEIRFWNRLKRCSFEKRKGKRNERKKGSKEERKEKKKEKKIEKKFLLLFYSAR